MSDEEISAGGSRIYRHEPKESEPELAQGDEALIEAVGDHVEQHVGPIARVLHEIISPVVHVDVFHVAPGESRPWHTLVTCGMSAKPMLAPEPDRAFGELTLALPPTWPMDDAAWSDERHYWPVRLLKFLARLPHEYDTWLGDGPTIPNDDHPALPRRDGLQARRRRRRAVRPARGRRRDRAGRPAARVRRARAPPARALPPPLSYRGGSFTTVTKNSSICRTTSMKRSKSTGLVTYAFACSL
jgi:hypothetical protein